MANVSLARRAENDVSPVVYDLRTACRVAGVSDRHLRKFFPDGPPEYQPKLAVCRIGGRLIIRRAALEAWLAAVEAQSIESLGSLT